MPNQIGMTLIELLVAMSIGLLITGTIIQAVTLTSASYRRAESLALMQEQADAAMTFLTADIRNAGHWGLAGGASQIEGRSTPTQANPLGLQTPTRCSARFVFDIAASIEAATDADVWQCAVSPSALSDTLTVRHASARTALPQPNRLQLHGMPGAKLADDGSDVTASGSLAELLNLNVRGYYVAEHASLFPDQPVLRRMTLTALSTRPHFINEEIAVGIEALQIAVDADLNGDGLTDITLHAGDTLLSDRDSAGLPAARVLGVHIDMIVRSADTGWSQAPSDPFTLGDLIWTAPADGRLRFVVRRFIAAPNQGLPL